MPSPSLTQSRSLSSVRQPDSRWTVQRKNNEEIKKNKKKIHQRKNTKGNNLNGKSAAVTAATSNSQHPTANSQTSKHPYIHIFTYPHPETRDVDEQYLM